MATTTQTRKLYGDEVTLHFNPNSRNRYQLGDGTAPVGVTTVLNILAKPALMLWPMNMALNFIKQSLDYDVPEDINWTEVLEEASKAHTRKSDKGKDTGSIVHEWIERFLTNPELASKVGVATEALKAIDAFEKWFNNSNAKVLATEQIVYSRELNVAGTFDFLCEIGGKTVLGDIKTSNLSRTAPRGCYPEAIIQLGAYAEIHAEMEPGIYIDDLLVVNATKEGKLFTTYASELGLSVEDCRNAFKSVLACYRFLTPLAKQLKELA